MATTKQKEAARRNVKKAQKARATKQPAKKRTAALSTAQQNDLPDSAFAFTKQRKERLVDAKHVRNAIARFDQVEGVTDADRTRAWKKIKAAAKKFDIKVSEDDWRDLFKGGKAKKK